MRSVAVAGLGLLALAVLAGCAGGGDGGNGAGSTTQPPGSIGLHFIALGDMGMGNDVQVKVAQAVAKVCALRPCDFAVGLGDNIYPSGAESPTDPAFESKFEVPYANLTFPFWMVLGNHDNGQNPTGAPAGEGGLGLWYSAGNNEVAYSKRTDRASDKWHMPARHYTFTQGNADFIGLDTNTFMWYGAPVGSEIATALQAQEEWLPQAVAGMTQPWRIGLGHHPYLSNSEHGNAGAYDGAVVGLVPGHNGDHFKQVFERELCDKLDLYIAGHDHALQWLAPVPACGKTQFLVSGGGGAGLYDLVGSEAALYQESRHGFFWVGIEGDTLTAVAYDDEGTEVYSGAMERSP